MIGVSRNVDLYPKIEGWETAAANAFDVAFLTANWAAAYSVDGGKKFKSVSPDDMTKPFGLTFCCDQDILYIPSINSFVWTLLSAEAPILLAVASPQQIQDSKALSWTTYLVPPTAFRRENDAFDYPQLAMGDNFLYLTANLGNPGGALIARLPLADIGARRTINASYVIVKDAAYICPAQLTGNKGWFGWMRNYSSLRIFSWRETSGAMDPSFDVAIATVPTENYHSLTPDNDDWLPDTSKIGPDISGAARSGQELWLAWSAGRKVAGKRENAVAQPHIEIAVINIQAKKLIRQRYIWNPDFAFAWPALAANPAQEVAMSFAWGGPQHYPQHAVGILKRREDFVTTTSGPSAGSGGHYSRTQLAFPNIDAFVAGGFNSPKGNGQAKNHPHYVVFHS